MTRTTCRRLCTGLCVCSPVCLEWHIWLVLSSRYETNSGTYMRQNEGIYRSPCYSSLPRLRYSLMALHQCKYAREVGAGHSKQNQAPTTTPINEQFNGRKRHVTKCEQLDRIATRDIYSSILRAFLSPESSRKNHRLSQNAQQYKLSHNDHHCLQPPHPLLSTQGNQQLKTGLRRTQNPPSTANVHDFPSLSPRASTPCTRLPPWSPA